MMSRGMDVYGFRNDSNDNMHGEETVDDDDVLIWMCCVLRIHVHVL